MLRQKSICYSSLLFSFSALSRSGIEEHLSGCAAAHPAEALFTIFEYVQERHYGY